MSKFWKNILTIGLSLVLFLINFSIVNAQEDCRDNAASCRAGYRCDPQEGCGSPTTLKCEIDKVLNIYLCETIQTSGDVGAGRAEYESNQETYAVNKKLWYDKYYEDFESELEYSGINEEAGNTAYIRNTIQANAFNWEHILGGWSPESVERLNTAGINPGNGGVIDFLAGGISTMIGEPPVNTGYYIASTLDEAGFVESTYAQGLGWSTLEPIMDVWKVFRNIAYVFFIFIFIVLGFMIMFRSKLGGQALVTIQTALPQIIVTLILITFSYAIGALMIDLIYWLIYIVLGIFSSSGLITDFDLARDTIIDGNVVDLAKQLIWKKDGNTVVAPVAEQIGNLVDELIDSDMRVVEFADNFLSGGAEILVRLVFSIALLFMILKLFFKLLQAYIGIIFNIIFGPIILLTNAIPGKNSFGNWIKGILANVMVFVVTVVMFIIGSALGNGTSFSTNPDLVSNNTTGGLALPFIGGGMDSGALTAIISMGILMMIPTISDSIQKMLGVENAVAGATGQIADDLKKAAKGAWYLPGRAIGARQAARAKYEDTKQQYAVMGRQPPNLDDQRRDWFWDYMFGRRK